MKQRKRLLIAIICVFNVLLLCGADRIHHHRVVMVADAPPLLEIRCTCYIQNGITASGAHTRMGIVAGKKEWLGRSCALYQIKEDGSVGEFLGWFEFKDTGAGIDTDGDGKGDSIINGTSIDVWRPTMKDAKNWIKENGDYVYMQLFDEGRG